MGLETANYIGGLVATNPTGSDPKSQGDDHIRLLKSVLQNTFAGFAGMVVVTGTEAQGSDANHYNITVSPAPAAYTSPTIVVFQATHTNTGGTSLAFNGLSYAPLLDANGNAAAAGFIQNGSIVVAYYNGTNFYSLGSNGFARLDSPTLTGNPKVPTQAQGDSSTNASSTAFVMQAIANATFNGVSTASVTNFSSSGSYPAPSAGQKFLMVELWGAGAGGGAGYVGSSGASAGGGGGAGGQYVRRLFRIADLTFPVPVTIGAGGTGGVGTGAAGNAGGNTSFGGYALAQGGPGGPGGAFSYGQYTAGPSVGNGEAAGGNGGAVVLNGPGGSGGSSALGGAGGGAGGPGNSTFGAGGPGGATDIQTSGQTGGAGGASTGAAGANGAASGTHPAFPTGDGGGGGGGGSTTNGGNGGSGGLASGGGGGGGALTGKTAGNGGPGGNGYARITAW